MPLVWNVSLIAVYKHKCIILFKSETGPYSLEAMFLGFAYNVLCLLCLNPCDFECTDEQVAFIVVK